VYSQKIKTNSWQPTFATVSIYRRGCRKVTHGMGFTISSPPFSSKELTVIALLVTVTDHPSSYWFYYTWQSYYAMCTKCKLHNQ
jgi:hypothetical protein